jgi:hypothetical protein
MNNQYDELEHQLAIAARANRLVKELPHYAGSLEDLKKYIASLMEAESSLARHGTEQ